LRGEALLELSQLGIYSGTHVLDLLAELEGMRIHKLRSSFHVSREKGARKWLFNRTRCKLHSGVTLDGKLPELQHL
jgi:hypothetical protein